MYILTFFDKPKFFIKSISQYSTKLIQKVFSKSLKFIFHVLLLIIFISF